MAFIKRIIRKSYVSEIASSLLIAFGLSLVAPLGVLAQVDFTDIEAGLIGVDDSSVAWGDYDGDGDLDILLTGDGEARIYRNDNGIFTDIDAGLVDVSNSSVAWGDYDGDGDLDILLAGSGEARIYRNDNGIFTNINAGLIGVSRTSVAWGDYDNDGDLDILLTGDSLYERISRIYRNDEGIFTDIDAGLIGVEHSSVAWGDYDNDGDLDILLTGIVDGGYVSCIYRNDEGNFTDIEAGLQGVSHSSVAWGDYDNDGDLDILLSGWSGSPEARIYRNDDGLFDEDGVLEDVEDSSVAWGDYDNDGDLDILLTGHAGIGLISLIYRNDNGSFTDIAAGLHGVDNSSVAWGDYDNDGDLDILLTGNGNEGETSLIYRNNSTVANTPPIAPEDLSALFVDGELQIRWNDASDTETPTPGLSYNVRIGTTPGGSEIFPPHALPSGLRTVAAMGNANHNTEWAFNLSFRNYYYWSVQTLDTSFKGSPFAEEAVWTGSGIFTSIEDVGGDQGRQLRLTWSRSPFDVPDADIGITGYEIYRRQDGRLEGWDYIAMAPAHGDEFNSLVVPTLCDSTAASGICWSTFMIRATTADPFLFVDSPPDSGYSVDNLPPVVPSGLRFASSTLLVWEESGDADFHYFTMYGSHSEVFDETAVFIDHTTDTEMDMTGLSWSFYYLTATDLAGNEGGAACTESPTDVLPGLPEHFALHAPAPNPFNPKTHLRFDLPKAATVSLKVYDLSGRLIRTLVDERREAGSYQEAWDGRDARGRAMATGVYLCRLETELFSESRQMILLK